MRRSPRMISDAEADAIVSEYLAGASLAHLAAWYKRSLSTIHRCLERRGVERRGLAHRGSGNVTANRAATPEELALARDFICPDCASTRLEGDWVLQRGTVLIACPDCGWSERLDPRRRKTA